MNAARASTPTTKPSVPSATAGSPSCTAASNTAPPTTSTPPGRTATPAPLDTSEPWDIYGLQYARVMASAMIAALPLLIVFMFFQRQIVRGVATTGMGGQ